jgi:hypothetical protein
LGRVYCYIETCLELIVCGKRRTIGRFSVARC